MAVDSPALLEVQPISDGMVVGVSFIHVRMSGGEMSSDETEVGIIIL